MRSVLTGAKNEVDVVEVEHVVVVDIVPERWRLGTPPRLLPSKASYVGFLSSIAPDGTPPPAVTTATRAPWT